MHVPQIVRLLGCLEDKESAVWGHVERTSGDIEERFVVDQFRRGELELAARLRDEHAEQTIAISVEELAAVIGPDWLFAAPDGGLPASACPRVGLYPDLIHVRYACGVRRKTSIRRD